MKKECYMVSKYFQVWEPWEQNNKRVLGGKKMGDHVRMLLFLLRFVTITYKVGLKISIFRKKYTHCRIYNTLKTIS